MSDCPIYYYPEKSVLSRIINCKDPTYSGIPKNRDLTPSVTDYDTETSIIMVGLDAPKGRPPCYVRSGQITCKHSTTRRRSVIPGASSLFYTEFSILVGQSKTPKNIHLVRMFAKISIFENSEGRAILVSVQWLMVRSLTSSEDALTDRSRILKLV